MSTSCINEARSHMSYKCNNLNQLSHLHSSRTLSDLQMAPNHEQSIGNGVVKMEHPDKQYTSDIKSSPQRFCEEKEGKKNLNFLNEPQDVPQSILKSGPKLPDIMVNELRKPSGSTLNGNNRVLCDELYRCFKCDFIGHNDDELHAHALKHDPYECSLCGFLANTRDNLKIHIKKDHPETAPDSWDDIVVFHVPPSPPSKRKKKPKTREMFIKSFEKPRKTHCKLCKIFIGKNKMEYFGHLVDAHSDSGRLLPCDMCPFIAVYKHHMEYHIRNHYGSKPFTCDKCDYECVNRSMLNSHYKSHSNIYQYACKNCSYLTKYLHSLKMHLRKYNHEPGRILNTDGSINTTTIIDVHGKRRGPKGKKRKSDLQRENNESPKSKSSPSPPSTFNQIPSQNIRILYNPHIYNNYTGNLYMNKEPSDYRLHSSPNSGGYTYKCAHCDFISESYSVYTYHLLSHPHIARNGGFDHYFPFYLPAQNMDYQFGNPYGLDLFPKNNGNQSTVGGQRNIGGNQEMNASNNGFHYHNSPNPMDCGSLGSIDMNKEDSSNDGIVIPPNAYPYPGLLGGKPLNNGIKSTLLSPKASSPGTDEIPETMNGLWTTFENSSADIAPLDLSFKQPLSPEMKRNGEISPYAQSLDLPLNLASSVGSTSGSESKSTPILKANRRKGKAFKLNQYVIENDPASDAIETESGLVKSSKPGIECMIKKSLPRINFKQSLNTPICNDHKSYQEFQPKMEKPICNGRKSYQEFQPISIPSKVQSDSVGTMDDVPSMKKRRISDESNDSWCSICCMDQGSAYLLQIHSSYHSANEPFTCAKCELRCQVKDVFIHHLIAGSRINGKCINAIEYES